MIPVTVHRTAEVAAVRHDVWKNLTDHSSWRGWFPGMWRVQPGTLHSGPGATRRVWVGPLRFDEQFDVWNEGRLAYRITEPPEAPGRVDVG